MSAVVNAPAVREYLKLPAGQDTEELATVCRAVDALVRKWVGTDLDEAERFGALMLAARVYRRRNSPAGVESLGEMGPVYVSRNDPDLAMMLGLARYAKPRVG